jgi:hypothetical protein
VGLEDRLSLKASAERLLGGLEAMAALEEPAAPVGLVGPAGLVGLVGLEVAADSVGLEDPSGLVGPAAGSFSCTSKRFQISLVRH